MNNNDKLKSINDVQTKLYQIIFQLRQMDAKYGLMLSKEVDQYCRKQKLKVMAKRRSIKSLEYRLYRSKEGKNERNIYDNEGIGSRFSHVKGTI